ncbi:MAG TPA: ATP-binding protein [Candidatus Kapabacteria bacterium]|jgi:serine/threonine-protein kinase RsbW|nr:ATP-binding protein [Candidatus Kapabacteria bacterium]HPU22801.1 ATP-binding protein [Candidatus Kapabacteria bacterium]
MENCNYCKVVIFRSEKASMTKVEPLLAEIKQKYSIPDDRFYNLLIALSEAFNNAIIHGNKLNPEKIVELEILCNDTDLKISVKDEGEGFDLSSVADPRESDNLLKENGRGIFLIRSLLDDAKFYPTKNGTTIELIFRLSNT